MSGVLLLLLLLAVLPPYGHGEPHPGSHHSIAMVTWRHETPAEKGFKAYLARSGLTITFKLFDAAQDPERLHGFIPSIRALKPDLIYVFGTTATRLVLSQISDIPVVFNVVTRPVAAGIIKSWERSGNNATGVSSMVPLVHQLKALKKVVDYQILAMLYNPLEPNSLIQKAQLEELSSRLGFSVMACPVGTVQDVEALLPDLARRADAVYLPSDSRIISLGNAITDRLNRQGLPTLCAVESLVIHHDALMGLVPDYYDLGTLAGSRALRILNGEAPGKIPCATLKYFRITINMDTARTIGVQIPTSLLIMSDTIIR